jgi:hypothetical protein
MNDVTTPGGTGRGYLPPYGTSSYGRIGPDVGDGAIPPEGMTEQDMIDEAVERTAKRYLLACMSDQGLTGEVDFEPAELNPQGSQEREFPLQVDVVDSLGEYKERFASLVRRFLFRA